MWVRVRRGRCSYFYPLWHPSTDTLHPPPTPFFLLSPVEALVPLPHKEVGPSEEGDFNDTLALCDRAGGRGGCGGGRGGESPPPLAAGPGLSGPAHFLLAALASALSPWLGVWRLPGHTRGVRLTGLRYLDQVLSVWADTHARKHARTQRTHREYYLQQRSVTCGNVTVEFAAT